MAWNPGSHQPKPQREYDDRPVPAGTYLLGITWWQRISPKFIKIRCEVLDGPLKGASVFMGMATNVEEKRGTADRMYWFCSAAGISGDLDFGDSCIQTKFIGAALKGVLRVEQQNGYTNHDFRQVVPRNQLSAAEGQILTEWSEAYRERRQNVAGDGGDFADGGENWGDNGWDDDVPF